MKADETLDEAIDRVAARMTAITPRAAGRLWPAPQRVRSGWSYWQVAGVGLVLGAIALAVAVTMPIVDRQPPQIAAAPIVVPRVDIALAAPVRPLAADPPPAPAARVPHVDGGEARRASTGSIAGPSVGGAAQRAERPTWGLPFIAERAALAVAPVDVPPLHVDAMEVVPVAVPSLTIEGLSADSDSRE